jgi:hypothetical protein
MIRSFWRPVRVNEGQELLIRRKGTALRLT